MNHLRTYIGSAGFIAYLSFWIGTIKLNGPSFLFFYLWLGDKDLLEPLDSMSDILTFIVLVEFSLIFLFIGYFFLNSIQKQYIAICGEAHICFFISYFLSYSFFKLNLVSMRTASFELFLIIFFLIILAYHFVINRKTLKDFDFRIITNIPIFILAVCFLFILFVVSIMLFFNRPIIFHLPSFNDCIFLFIIQEEIMFRYYIQKEGVQAFGVYPSIIIASLLFSLIHFVSGILLFRSFIYLLLMGCIIGWAYQKCNNFSVPIVLHGLFNLLIRMSF